MTDFQLLTKISTLPPDLKKEVEDFVDFLKSKASVQKPKKAKRQLGKGKGTVVIKDNFDDPIEDFKEYM
jgi:hypothetical protein